MTMLYLSHAHQAFDEAGRIKDSVTEQRLKKLLMKCRDHAAGSNTI